MRKAGFTNIIVKPFDFLHPAVPASLIPAISTVRITIEKIPLLKEIAGSLYISVRKPLP